MKTLLSILATGLALGINPANALADPVLHDGDASECTYYPHMDSYGHDPTEYEGGLDPEYWKWDNVVGEYVVPDVPSVQQYVDTTLTHPNCVRQVNTWSVSFSPPAKDSHVSVSAFKDLPAYVSIVDTLYGQICSAVGASFSGDPTITVSASCSTKSISNTEAGVLDEDSGDIVMAWCTKWKARAYYYKMESPVVAVSFKECQWNCQHYTFDVAGAKVPSNNYNSQGEGVCCTISGFGNHYAGLYLEVIYDGECPLTGDCAQTGS